MNNGIVQVSSLLMKTSVVQNILNDALTSTCTASEVQLRARTRTAMVASVAFMVVADSLAVSLSLAVDVLSRCLAQCVCLPSVHRPPFKQFTLLM